MTIQEHTIEIIERLKQKYPAAICSLTYENPLHLLIATRLAAQCTDIRVNLVTPALFSRYPDARSFAEADVAEVEQLIKSCGLYKTKARDLVEIGRTLIAEFDGEVPREMDDLLKLKGIGRKTANLVRGDIFGLPAVVTDTHCIRISNRLGLCNTKDPFKVEKALEAILPPEESNDFCHRMVLFGRDICTARSPKCGECPLADICEYFADFAAFPENIH